ncbi:glycoside hydrolase family 66 protein [Niallia sp. 03133]|uniref:glycoside hydrolase family 66 protein n=1 Tax=Niallia sp. 03133 TaxID=3458060 RepID=UPI0040441AD9
MFLKKKSILLLVIILLIAIGIGYTYTSLYPSKKLPEQTKKEAPLLQADLIQALETDKAAYHPNDSIAFSLKLADNVSNGRLKISYFHLNKEVSQQEIKVDSNQVKWTWKPPAEDFQGYLVRASFTSSTEKEEETIGVDVSSDWSKFPRYGFLSSFPDMQGDEEGKIISSLNRHHINGIQFYDWHYKHHQPLKMENNAPAPYWEDIANRPTSLKTIKSYIDLAHQHNMKTMAYNLLYGAFAEAEKDGVQTEWRLFKDNQKNAQDFHPLPDNWKSDVFLVNPGNIAWQDYLFNQQKIVYNSLPFDGWHIDQLGPRGTVYDYDGNEVVLDDTFLPFLDHAKSSMPDKRLVINAVNQYGQKQIGQAPVDFLYTEVWDDYKYFQDLKQIIEDNKQYSQGKNSVLAAYMNYNASNNPGEFNPAGILLADSVIFASGGSHLELGEHMLSKEYFPHHNFMMSPSLQESIKHYYDFIVAYENMLRDNVENDSVTIDGDSFSTEPEIGKIWSFAKQKENKKILHLINLSNATTLEWRDTDANQAEPQERKDVPIKLEENRTVENIWMASPDKDSGVPIPLSFEQKDGTVSFTLPSLKYWDMVVVEYGE